MMNLIQKHINKCTKVVVYCVHAVAVSWET